MWFAEFCSWLNRYASGDDEFISDAEVTMNISRRLGILVFCAVPAIIGGGIVYAIFDNLTAMWIYEVLLAISVGALVSR